MSGKTTGIVSEKAAVDLQNVLKEASQWIKEVIGKKVQPSNFRQELENGIILCELIERIHPGSIRRINRMNIAMAHLDNLKQFLNACEKFGLKDSQLFDVTDLQEQSTLRIKSGGIKHTTADRRLRNVCVTIYWLGRKLAMTPSYTGPQLNLEAFREILDLPVNQTNFYLKGYEHAPPTTQAPPITQAPPTTVQPNHNKTSTKQVVVMTTCEIDLEPMSPPRRVEIKTVQKEHDASIQLEGNGLPATIVEEEPVAVSKVSPMLEEEPVAGDDLTPDELIATIQSAVDELLMDYEPPKVKKTQKLKTTENDHLLQRKERSFSSPSPTSLSSPSPTAQPAPLFLNIRILSKPGVSLGLQLIGGADTAIPAQVEVVMPGKPAEASGLKAGDIIITVDEQDVTRLTHHQLIDFIKQSVSKGSLLLGVERSVELPGRIHKSDSTIIHEEERAERERQKKEVDELYRERVDDTYTGYSKAISDNSALLDAMLDMNYMLDDVSITQEFLEESVPGKEVEKERDMSNHGDTTSDDEVYTSDRDDIDVEINTEIQWQSPKQMTTKESVSRLEEELEALANLVTKKSNNSSSDVEGIGKIEPKVVTERVTMEIEKPVLYTENDSTYLTKHKNGESISDNGQTNNRNIDDNGLLSGDRNVGDNVTDDVPTSDMPASVNAVLYRKDEWRGRGNGDGKEEVSISPVPPPISHVHVREEDDPFAPIAMKESSSTHLLSDVLSVHKTEFKPSYTNPMPTYAKVDQTKRVRSHSSSDKTSSKSIGPTHKPMQQPRPQIPQARRHPNKSDFELQDEIQEMHGIKVRAVQRTRWTPPATTPQAVEPPTRTSRHPPPPLTHSASVSQSMITKKSSIYERRDVVLMEVRGRSWTNAANVGGANYKQDNYKRPWSSQPRRSHHACSHCRGPIYQGPMMAIPDKDLYFHSKCLVCVVCRSSVSMNYGRATVFLRHSLPHCTSCYSNDNGIKVTTC